MMSHTSAHVAKKGYIPTPGRQSTMLQQLERHMLVRAAPEPSLVVPTGLNKDDRLCYAFSVPQAWANDTEAVSSIRLLENDRYLGPGAADHEHIREFGAGAFSHWGSTVFFSTSDNSDPTTNERVYSVVPPRGWVAETDDEWFDCKTLNTSAEQATDTIAWTSEVVSAADIRAQGATLYSVTLRSEWESDTESLSTLILLENERPLRRNHQTTDDILSLKRNAYGHWGSDVVFATSDGTDPRTNGRLYRMAHAPAFRLESGRTQPRPETRNCWVVFGLPASWSSDPEDSSKLRLYEDGKLLGPSNALHDQIRRVGEGAYCQWNDQLWFSTSDNTSPNTNGRTYAVTWGA